MNITSETTVGALAAEHPLATRVFARHGIDFCCGGGIALAQACSTKGLTTETILGELEAEIAGDDEPVMRWDEAPLTDLIAHILRTYHEPLKEEMPRIEAMARKVNQVHGDKDPQRFQSLLDTFLALQHDLDQHLLKEEQILFPMICAGQGAMGLGPMSVMESEHELAGDMLRKLRELTWDYQVPEGACNTWRALWAALEDMEHSLHEHIHLENNILHPRARRS